MQTPDSMCVHSKFTVSIDLMCIIFKVIRVGHLRTQKWSGAPKDTAAFQLHRLECYTPFDFWQPYEDAVPEK